MRASKAARIVLDGHVHLHEPEALGVMLDQAWHNLSNQACFREKASTAVVLLAEMEGRDHFSRLRQRVLASPPSANTAAGEWRFLATKESNSLLARKTDEQEVWLLSGRQLVSSERLELLAFAAGAQLSSGAPLEVLIEEVLARRGLAIVPWGAGKWLGERGALVTRVLRLFHHSGLLLGDNGGRPACWRHIPQFTQAQHQGVKILRGSDPLPLAGECQRIGSFGSYLEGLLDRKFPCASLGELLTKPGVALQPFGASLSLLAFLQKQYRLRRAR